jgi:hypothetical protein
MNDLSLFILFNNHQLILGKGLMPCYIPALILHSHTSEIMSKLNYTVLAAQNTSHPRVTKSSLHVIYGLLQI